MEEDAMQTDQTDNRGMQPFRYLGLLIQNNAYARRYCDVLDVLTQTQDELQKSAALLNHFKKNPQDAVICTYKLRNEPALYLGCICYAGNSGNICTTFGMFDKNKNRLDPSLSELRKLNREDWSILVYYTEMQAGQLDLRKKNEKAVIVDRSFGLSELDFLANDKLVNYQRVEDLHLEERAPDDRYPHLVTTRKELHDLAEKSRKIADRRREDSAR